MQVCVAQHYSPAAHAKWHGLSGAPLTCMHTYTHTCIHTCTHTDRQAGMQDIHTYRHIYIHIHTYSHRHSCRQAHIYTWIQTYTATCGRTHYCIGTHFPQRMTCYRHAATTAPRTVAVYVFGYHYIIIESSLYCIILCALQLQLHYHYITLSLCSHYKLYLCMSV